MILSYETLYFAKILPCVTVTDTGNGKNIETEGLFGCGILKVPLRTLKFVIASHDIAKNMAMRLIQV